MAHPRGVPQRVVECTQTATGFCLSHITRCEKKSSTARQTDPLVDWADTIAKNQQKDKPLLITARLFFVNVPETRLNRREENDLNRRSLLIQRQRRDALNGARFF